MADTHKQRVLDLLSDGTPHSHREGYRLGVMLHSRVADLRCEGYRVDCWREGDVYWYRLLNEPDGREVGPRVSGSLSGQPASPLAASFPAPGDDDGNQLAAQIDGQLTLTGSEFRRSAA